MKQNGNYLREKIEQVTEKALEKKALHPILTTYDIKQENHTPFLIRMVENLARKDHAKKQQKEKQKESTTFLNPFLPYDQDLFIEEISETHVAILNKYNVFNHHLLIITKEFESQEKALNVNDFSALWTILTKIKGLGFYNSGKLSGASQPHKHLQLVPYPLVEEIDTIPLDHLILCYQNYPEIVNIKELPYQHSIVFFEDINNKTNQELSTLTFTAYCQLLDKLNISIEDNIPSQNYNLLITENWMMIIPRSQEKYHSISINSLGFAGAFLVKNKEQLDLVMNSSLLDILASVGIKKNCVINSE